MKQVIVEMEDEAHAKLKERAAANFRKIPQQLLFEASQVAKRITRRIPRSRKKEEHAA